VTLSIVFKSVAMLSIIHYSVSFMMNVANKSYMPSNENKPSMLSNVILSVIMLIVIILSVLVLAEHLMKSVASLVETLADCLDH
jgi:hypothetical protein